MAFNNFILKVSATDTDGNVTSEDISVKVGPSESAPPDVVFVFPSFVRVEAGDDIDPLWDSGTKLSSAFCKVFPTARPEEGGTGNFFVQHYYNSGNWPNNPSHRFEKTFEGVGGQLTSGLSVSGTNFMLVSSGIGIQGSGLCQASDLEVLRKGIWITNNAAAATAPTTTTNFGKTVTIFNGVDVQDADEVISAYTHDLATNRVYTLERGSKALGLTPKAWATGAVVLFHPYHYAPMYSNTTGSDTTVLPTIIVQEEGTQFPLIGTFTVSGTSVTGTASILTVQISGTTNLIKFGDAESWYIISGVLSSSGLVIYDYGDSLYLTGQSAQVNAYTKGSGLITVQPDLAGCSNWGVTITPILQNGDSVPSLSVNYSAVLESINPGGSISGTPRWSWQVLSGTTWSGLTPGNLQTQTVTYEANVAKRIRVQVSGTGQPACMHEYDTGPLSLTDAISAGTWGCTQSTSQNQNGDVQSAIKFESTSTRVAGKYYHHNLYAMKPLNAKTGGTINTNNMSTIPVQAGSVNNWPSKGTFVLKGPIGFASLQFRQYYFRASYSGKTNSSLTGISNATWFGISTLFPYSQGDNFIINNPNQTMSAGFPLWLQQHVPTPFSFVTAKTAANKVKVRSSRGFNNGSTTRYVRFALPHSSNVLINANASQPYQVTSLNSTTHELTLDRNLESWIDEDVICFFQTFKDASGPFYPLTVPVNRLNAFNMTGWIHIGAVLNSPAVVPLSSTTTATLNIVDYMSGTFPSMQYFHIAAVGRMVIPDINGPIVIEYNGLSGPTPSSQLGAFYWTLLNVKIVSDLSGGVTSANLPPRAFLIPYQECAITPISDVVFEPTDASTTYTYNGGTSKLLGWMQPLIDVVYATDSLNEQQTTVLPTTIPPTPEYEDSVYSAYPEGGVRGYSATYISHPNVAVPAETPDEYDSKEVPGCLHYNTKVEILRDNIYETMILRHVEPGMLIKTPVGPREILDRIESDHKQTHIIQLNNDMVIHCTSEHPIATPGLNGEFIWKKAGELELFDEVVTVDFDPAAPAFVTLNLIIQNAPDTPHKFYDLTIEECPQFYANGILVHNKVKKTL